MFWLWMTAVMGLKTNVTLYSEPHFKGETLTIKFNTEPSTKACMNLPKGFEGVTSATWTEESNKRFINLVCFYTSHNCANSQRYCDRARGISAGSIDDFVSAGFEGNILSIGNERYDPSIPQ